MLRLLKRRPAAQEIAEHDRVLVFEPLRGLGEVLLQRIGQPVSDTDPVIDQASALFDQVLQGPHGHALRPEEF